MASSNTGASVVQRSAMAAPPPMMQNRGLQSRPPPSQPSFFDPSSSPSSNISSSIRTGSSNLSVRSSAGDSLLMTNPSIQSYVESAASNYGVSDNSYSNNNNNINNSFNNSHSQQSLNDYSDDIEGHGKSTVFYGKGVSVAPPRLELFIGVIVGSLVISFLVLSMQSWGLNLFFVFSVTCGSLVFAAGLCQWLLAKDDGTLAMRQVSDPIREGSEGFFRTQYTTIARISIIVAIGIFFLYWGRELPEEQASIDSTSLALFTAVSFLLGCVCSGMAGYVGMWVSVRANVRVAAAARHSYAAAIQLCLRGGGFSGIIVVGLTLLGIISLFTFCYFVFSGTHGIRLTQIPLLLVGYAFGASFVALFAQLGGGIFTKAADVGADMVGKIEVGIPEDDPRNPAVIADLVGDNVGDCAGRGADLFESIAAEIISAMILGGRLAEEANLSNPMGFVMFPLVIHAFDLIVSTVGIMTINSRGGIYEFFGNSNMNEDPLTILKRGYMVAVSLAIVFFTGATSLMLHDESAPDAWWHFALCGLIGIATAYAFVLITQYYTDYAFRPVLEIASASLTGHGTNIIAGIGVGLESTALPILTISAAILGSFYLGQTSGLKCSGNNAGIFGTACATLGMLSTAVFILAMDVFGPIADNAGGIVEMSGQPEAVREITDRLDSVGNVTKATTKGYAVGSASLACFLLFGAYMDEVAAYSGVVMKSVDISDPNIFVGGLLGACLVFVFSSWALKAVGASAQEVVREVRRQFREKPGIMTWTETPDYRACVSIVAERALKEMVRPGLLAILSPIIVGVLFRIIGSYTNSPDLAARGVLAFLMFATVSGILMGLFLNNAGGAWDNAKKYIEQGNLGGKGSDAHHAAVTGDTVGDPFKDTAGPSLHVLIKLLATMSLVLVPFLVAAPFKVK